MSKIREGWQILWRGVSELPEQLGERFLAWHEGWTGKLREAICRALGC